MTKKSELQEYLEWTETTDFVRDRIHSNALQYYTLGLCSEAGEVADLVAKGMRVDTEVVDPTELKAELGDTLYYMACICRQFGWTFEELARSNQVKLIARHLRDKHANAFNRLKDEPLEVTTTYTKCQHTNLTDNYMIHGPLSYRQCNDCRQYTPTNTTIVDI